MKKSKKLTPKKLYIHLIKPHIEIENFAFHSVDQLAKIKDQSLEEIAIQDLLEYCSDEEGMLLLSKIVAKLKTNGKLHIQGIDIKAACAAITYSQIDNVTFKTLLFMNNKKNIYSITSLKQSMKNSLSDSVEITRIKFLNGMQYYIECHKK